MMAATGTAQFQCGLPSRSRLSSSQPPRLGRSSGPSHAIGLADPGRVMASLIFAVIARSVRLASSQGPASLLTVVV
jgi:hypothetical protein